MSGLFKKLDEAIIVTRGYLAFWQGMILVFSGMTLSNSKTEFMQWSGMFFSIVGLAILLICFRYILKKPQPFDPNNDPKAEV